MPETRHIRKLGSVPYVSGSRETLEIDRAGVLATLWLRLTFTVTNGSSAAVGPFFQTLSRLLQRIEVIVGGRDTVWSVAGPMLTAMLLYENGRPSFGMDSTVVLTGSSTATVYTVAIPLRFTLPNSRRPDDCALDIRGDRVSQTSVHITWGPSDASDFYGTPNSAAISAVSLNIEGEYILDVPADRAFLVRSVDQTRRDVTGNNDNFDVVMDRGSGLFYRSFLIAALADKVGSNSIVNNVRLEAGSFVFRNQHPTVLRAMAQERSSLTTAELLAGVLSVPVTWLGQGVTMINTGLLTSDLKFIFDVTKTGTTCVIDVLREAVRPLKTA